MFVENKKRLYSINEIRDMGEVEVLKYSIFVKKNEAGIISFAFFCYEDSSQELELDEDSQLKLLVQGSGLIDSKECRHTFWGDGDNGYINYPKIKTINEVLSHLENYFNLNN